MSMTISLSCWYWTPHTLWTVYLQVQSTPSQCQLWVMLGQAGTIHQFSLVSLIGHALPIWVYFPTLWMQLFHQYFVKWQLPNVLVSSFCIHNQKCTPLHILASFPADKSIDSSVSVTIAALTSGLVAFSCVVLFATTCLYYYACHHSEEEDTQKGRSSFQTNSHCFSEHPEYEHPRFHILLMLQMIDIEFVRL